VKYIPTVFLTFNYIKIYDQIMLSTLKNKKPKPKTEQISFYIHIKSSFPWLSYST